MTDARDIQKGVNDPVGGVDVKRRFRENQTPHERAQFPADVRGGHRAEVRDEAGRERQARHRADRARVVRDGIVVHTADIAALKRYKDDVKEVATNFECGISLVNFNDIQVGDVLETFTEIEVKQTL